MDLSVKTDGAVEEALVAIGIYVVLSSTIKLGKKAYRRFKPAR